MGEQKSCISRRSFLGGAVVLGVASLATNPLVAFATPTAAEKQAEADQVRVQVQSLKSDLVDKSNAYGAALDEQDKALAAMEEAQMSIDATSVRIAGLQDKLGTRARSMYRSGSITFIDLLFGATSFAEFATNWDLLNRMNEGDAEMVAQSKVLRADLQAAYDEHAKQERIAAEKAEEARIAKQEAETVANHYQAILDSLDAETRELILAEQEAAAVASAAQQIAQQESGQAGGSSGSGLAGSGSSSSGSSGGSWGSGSSGSSGNSSGSSNSGSGGGSAADYGPPAGDILSEAMKYLGLPYKPGGTDPSYGFDCSGLVYYCCQRTGHAVPPRSTYGYPSSGWFPVSEAQPGDILWQQNHVGICASPGGGSYVHAANEQYGVCYGSSPQFTRAYRY